MGAYHTLSASWNGYGYAHGNLVNLVDPSGEFIPIIAAILIGAAIGGALSGGINLAGQLHENGGDWGCLDLGEIAGAFIEGAVLGGISGGAGFAAGAAFGAETAGAFFAGEAADLAAGTAWDMAVHHQSFEDALIGNAVGNVVGFGIGGLAGVAGNAVGKAWKASGADALTEGLTRRLSRAIENVELPELRLRDRFPIATREESWRAGASLRRVRGWFADENIPRQNYLPGFEPDPQQLSLFNSIDYGELDELGRPTLVTAVLEHEIQTGTRASRRISVPNGFDRGHLLV